MFTRDRSTAGRPSKKLKKAPGQSSSNQAMATTIQSAWKHYNAFLESANEHDGDGDTDELHEIVNQVSSDVTALHNKPVTSMEICKSLSDLLPLLISLTHYHLAEHAIRSGDGPDEVLRHLQASLSFVPGNPVAWNLAADYAGTSHLGSPAAIVQWHLTAANAAAEIRAVAIKMMDGELKVDGEAAREWVSLLMLDGMAGVEFIEEGEDEGYYTPSAIEGNCRFAAAMLLSTLGSHDLAMRELQHFDLTHRLSPHVWIGGVTATADAVAKPSQRCKNGSVPCVYRNNVLPDSLYRRLCSVFAPDAVYWQETDYEQRGYYSYFMDMVKTPTNVMEQVIFEHLLPLAQQRTSKKIVGAEWWVHTRPIGANLGHNLHFDTDEAMLAQDGEITHPVVSSVLYLTGNASKAETSPAGSTIVLDQTPNSKNPAKTCYICPPRDNSYLVFAGDMLHGVLPCPGTMSENSTLTKPSNQCGLSWTAPTDDAAADANMPNRLTLMVGFWTRRVPDQMKERSLYGPCGPMPVDSDWMKQLLPKVKATPTSPTPEPLRAVSPAWESIEPRSDESVPWLEIPRGVDHRFFVKGAPQCFRDSMFPDEDDDESAASSE